MTRDRDWRNSVCGDRAPRVMRVCLRTRRVHEPSNAPSKSSPFPPPGTRRGGWAESAQSLRGSPTLVAGAAGPAPAPEPMKLRCCWARTAAYVPAAPRPRHSRGMTGLDRARGGLAPGRRAAWRGRPATAGMLGRITGRPSLQGGSRACAEATLRACQSKFAGPGRSRGSERRRVVGAALSGRGRAALSVARASGLPSGSLPASKPSAGRTVQHVRVRRRLKPRNCPPGVCRWPAPPHQRKRGVRPQGVCRRTGKGA